MSDERLLEHLRGMKYRPQLERDLWPGMEQRLAHHAPRFTHWDWAIAAGIAAAMLLYPDLAAALLYHL
ncbi:MAG: hypothetical protein U0R19_20900 [Bryobacteraceae bacterium]